MEYKIEDIGASFTDKDIQKLKETFDNSSKEGFEFHSVINVEHRTGCLGMEQKTTYLAVYVK